MSDLHMNEISKKMLRVAAVSVFAPVLAPMFPTLRPAYSASSHGLLLTFRDGTDPLLGGQQAAPAARPGGAS
jgi:hypothetical protein